MSSMYDSRSAQEDKGVESGKKRSTGHSHLDVKLDDIEDGVKLTIHEQILQSGDPNQEDDKF